MKRFLLVTLLLAGCLAGCAAQETFETIADEWEVPIQAVAKEISLKYPEDASLLTGSSDAGGAVYFCEDYTFSLQVLPSGDLDKTLREVTGFGREDLTVMETEQSTVQATTARYDWVWSCAGEAGDQVCRGAILDDGNFHYVLTAMVPEEKAKDVEAGWDRMFQSFWVA